MLVCGPAVPRRVRLCPRTCWPRGPGQALVGLIAVRSLRLLQRQPNSDLLVFTIGKVNFLFLREKD